MGVIIKQKQKLLHGLLVFIIFNFIIVSCNSNLRSKLVYQELFGSPIADCSEIINFKNLDFAIDSSVFFELKLCPSEFKRILKHGNYSRHDALTKIEARTHEKIKYGNGNPSWWKPSKLGDSCIWYTSMNKNAMWVEVIYASPDSTRILYRESGY